MQADLDLLASTIGSLTIELYDTNTSRAWYHLVYRLMEQDRVPDQSYLLDVSRNEFCEKTYPTLQQTWMHLQKLNADLPSTLNREISNKHIAPVAKEWPKIGKLCEYRFGKKAYQFAAGNTLQKLKEGIPAFSKRLTELQSQNAPEKVAAENVSISEKKAGSGPVESTRTNGNPQAPVRK